MSFNTSFARWTEERTFKSITFKLLSRFCFADKIAVRPHPGVNRDRIHRAAEGIDLPIKLFHACGFREVDLQNVDSASADSQFFSRSIDSSSSAAMSKSNPCCANCLANSKPIPLDAPVITASGDFFGTLDGGSWS